MNHGRRRSRVRSTFRIATYDLLDRRRTDSTTPSGYQHPDSGRDRREKPIGDGETLESSRVRWWVLLARPSTATRAFAGRSRPSVALERPGPRTPRQSPLRPYCQERSGPVFPVDPRRVARDHRRGRCSVCGGGYTTEHPFAGVRCGRATDRPTETRRGILSASRRHGKRPLNDDTRSPSVERPSGSVLTGARRRRDRPPDVYDGPGRCADDGWSCLPTVHSRGGGHGAGRRRSVEPSRPATPLVRTTPLQSGVFDPRQVSADVDVVPSPPRRPGIPVSESDDRVRCPRTVRTDRSLYTIFYIHTWRVAIRVDSAL